MTKAQPDNGAQALERPPCKTRGSCTLEAHTPVCKDLCPTNQLQCSGAWTQRFPLWMTLGTHIEEGNHQNRWVDRQIQQEPCGAVTNANSINLNNINSALTSPFGSLLDCISPALLTPCRLWLMTMSTKTAAALSCPPCSVGQTEGCMAKWCQSHRACQAICPQGRQTAMC